MHEAGDGPQREESEGNEEVELEPERRFPIGEGNLTTGGIIVAAAIALVTLIAAILGGLAGMRYQVAWLYANGARFTPSGLSVTPEARR